MRYRFVLAVTTACLVSVTFQGLRAGAQGAAAQRPVPTNTLTADMILVNGKIVTVDDPSVTSNIGTIAQAVAVRGTDILAVGTNAQVRAFAGPKTKEIDLKGRTVLPSFSLTHEHPTDWAWSEPEAMRHVFGNGTDFLQMRWLTGTAKEQFASWESVLSDMVAKAKPGQWIWLSFSLGANLENAEEIFANFDKIVTPAKVEALTPNNPVRVKRGWPLSTIENSKALAEIKKYYPEMDFTAADRAREATPRIVEPDVIMRGHKKELAALLKAEMELWVAHGVTAFGSSPYNIANLEALRYLDERGEMPARFGWAYTGPDFHESVLRYVSTILGTGTPHLFNIGAWLYEGGSCTTAEASPEVKARERCSFAPGSEGREVLERIIRTGNRVATMHTWGDKDIDYYMDAIERASKEAGFTVEDIRAKRFAFDHGMSAPRPDQIPRVKRLGMMVSMINTAIWENRTSYDASYRAKDYGIEYVKWSVPRKSVTAAGVMNTAEIDRPLPHKLFYNVWVGMTRYNEGRGRTFAPDEGTDRLTQLKALTTWGSHYFFREKTMGSLEAGKLADLIVLDRDFLTVPEREIPQLKVLMTMVGGKIGHLRPELASEIGMQPVGPVTWPTQPLDKYFIQPPVQMPSSAP